MRVAHVGYCARQQKRFPPVSFLCCDIVNPECLKCISCCNFCSRRGLRGGGVGRGGGGERGGGGGGGGGYFGVVVEGGGVRR